MVRPNPGDVGDDNWYSVEDRRQRKRIQDRLAQRARRRRIADSKKDVQLSNGAVESTSVTLTPSTGVTSPTVPSDDIDTILRKATSKLPEMLPSSQMPIHTRDGKSGIMGEMEMTASAALYENGSRMGLLCSNSWPSKSDPVGPDIPASLQPTALQLTTIHPRWIDRFPFPRMRDNLIASISFIEEEEFLQDLFCMTSFMIRPGGAPWDPTAWVIGVEFYVKWAFLFTDEAVDIAIT